MNALLDKAEDPAKMIDQTLLNLRKDLAEVKKETAVMADEKCKRKSNRMRKQIADYKAAANALVQGMKAMQEHFWKQRRKKKKNCCPLQKTYDMTAANADNMQAMHDKLVRILKPGIKTRFNQKQKMATAKAQKHMNQVLSGGDKASKH